MKWDLSICLYIFAGCRQMVSPFVAVFSIRENNWIKTTPVTWLTKISRDIPSPLIFFIRNKIKRLVGRIMQLVLPSNFSHLYRIILWAVSIHDTKGYLYFFLLFQIHSVNEKCILANIRYRISLPWGLALFLLATRPKYFCYSDFSLRAWVFKTLF